jgi:arabinoxylan arabinofuranohydrolase
VFFVAHFPFLRRFGVAVALAGAAVPPLRADYPIASQHYLADPAPLVTRDEVYIYCSNDDLNPVQGGYNIPSVICVSSRDMKNWTDHGVVFDAARDTSWADKAWAPSPVARDGKVFLYFGNGGANIGVVAGGSPTGPFQDVLGHPLITAQTAGVMPADKMWLFDPAAFVDDNGQAYLYFGGNGEDNPRVIRLNPDMISTRDPAVRLHAPAFFEAAWMHKRDGVYYFSYSTNPRAGLRIDYMTSNSPVGGFTYRGVLAEQPPVNHNNNHAAEFEFKGAWYHVYHNRELATEEHIPTGFRRNLAIDRLDYGPDGSIRPVVYTTDGLPQVGHLNPYHRVEAETFAAQHGITTEPCSAGGLDVTGVENGDWIKVAGVDFGKVGARAFTASVASGGAGGQIEVYLDSLAGPQIGLCSVANTGAWQTWQTARASVSGATGVHDLYLRFIGDPGKLPNLDWWRFE